MCWISLLFCWKSSWIPLCNLNLLYFKLEKEKKNATKAVNNESLISEFHFAGSRNYLRKDHLKLQSILRAGLSGCFAEHICVGGVYQLSNSKSSEPQSCWLFCCLGLMCLKQLESCLDSLAWSTCSYQPNQLSYCGLITYCLLASWGAAVNFELSWMLVSF